MSNCVEARDPMASLCASAIFETLDLESCIGSNIFYSDLFLWGFIPIISLAWQIGLNMPGLLPPTGDKTWH